MLSLQVLLLRKPKDEGRGRTNRYDASVKVAFLLFGFGSLLLTRGLTEVLA